MESSLTPAFVIDEKKLRANLEILKRVREESGCRMYHALKTWATPQLFPIVREYIDGAEASSLYEARMGSEEWRGEVHVFAPAYKEEEFDELLAHAHTIIFNSFADWKRFKERVSLYDAAHGTKHECGLRINPEYADETSHGGLWDPCAPGSRLGIRASEWQRALKEDPRALEGISGLHFHIFFDKGLGDLKRALAVVEEKFGAFIPTMEWINWGGGQTITSEGYDVAGLVTLIKEFQKKHNVRVHLEPGAAIVKNAGFLRTRVLDIIERDDVSYSIAILDMSFNAHTPDFLLAPDLDMPVTGARIVRDPSLLARESNTYRLGGSTCVTGDVLGTQWHVFEEALTRGDILHLEDGIQYNMVQCTMFNGVQHPAIVFRHMDGKEEILRTFTYEDYRARMG